MIQIERILCPVDATSYSERALGYAVALASWYDAELVALSVRPRSHTAKRLVGSFSGRDPEHSPPPFVARLLGESRSRVLRSEGPVVREILRAAREISADLVVMGTRGTVGLERFLLGSVTEKVLRSAPCPVLTVPRRMDAEAARAVALGTILCAVDFSPASKRALEYALSIARKSGGRLLLVHALEWFAEEVEALPPHTETPEFPTSEQDARHQLDDLLPPDSTVEVVVGYGTPHHEVLRVAREVGADLIVLGVQGRGKMDLTLFGSTTKHVVQQATCPVVTVREPSGGRSPGR